MHGAAALWFVCRFLPGFCPDHLPVSLEHEFVAAGVDPRERKANERRLEPTLWGLAWDAYTLAAAALGQVSPVFVLVLLDCALRVLVC